MPTLPTGTVTFLFTDIAGSTKLWQESPQTMPSVLARHDTLLRQAIERNNGVVVKTIGDAFMAAFPTAQEGVQAALTAQSSLCAEPWPQETPVRVRMGLHTGASEERDNDYYGHEVNRAARIQGVVHAEQIIISQAVYALVKEELPNAVTLLDLGLHQLKDLREPEHLWQVCHPNLPATFPPLNSLTYWPNNLPHQLSSFVGREGEMAEVKRFLSRCACLTLIGSGGCGKTRLALQVGAEVLPEYAHGVWLIELAALTEPSLVPQTVASAMGLREEPGKTVTQVLLEYCKSRPLLVVLDNCEHLLPACAQLTDALLRSCPQMKVLATSREALNIAGEQTYRIPSLSLPDPQQTLTTESLTWYEAPRLFVERAMLAKSDFALRDTMVPFVAQLCQHLDGIPLAIELAAARVKALSVEQIAGRLNDRFHLLTGGNRTALPRQQTLRALIDWSYDLLNPSERKLLARLSVFSGGWTLEAVEQVCSRAGIEVWEVLDLLSSLVDKSLVLAEEREGVTRYGLLETVREYASEKQAVNGETQELRTQHREYYRALAEEVGPKLSGAEQIYWLNVLEMEHDNLRLAQNYCPSEPDEIEAGMRIAVALQQFWVVRGHLYETRERLQTLLALPETQGRTQMRANALHAAGVMAWNQGDYAAARLHYQQSLTIRRELGDRKGIAISLNNLGILGYQQGDYADARLLLEEALVLLREFGNRAGIVAVLNNLGNTAWFQGDFVRARSLHEESLASSRELGDCLGIARSLVNLGNVAKDQGDYGQAGTLHAEALTLYQELGDRVGIAHTLNNLGTVAFAQKDYAHAQMLQEESIAIRRELGDRHGIAMSQENLANIAEAQGEGIHARLLYEESLAIRRELGDKSGIITSLEHFATLARVEGNPTRATLLWGTVESLRETIGKPPIQDEQEKQESERAVLQKSLGAAKFAATWTKGRTMTLDQAVAYALQEAL